MAKWTKFADVSDLQFWELCKEYADQKMSISAAASNIASDADNLNWRFDGKRLKADKNGHYETQFEADIRQVTGRIRKALNRVQKAFDAAFEERIPDAYLKMAEDFNPWLGFIAESPKAKADASLKEVQAGIDLLHTVEILKQNKNKTEDTLLQMLDDTAIATV